MSQAVDTWGCLNNTIKVAAGHYVDLLNPDPATIDIRSIAAALSKICRFGGHCPRFYSVAEHCMLATGLAKQDGCSNEVLRAVLLHDAAEAYVGDMVKPFKITIPEYAIAERRMEQAISEAFNVDFQDCERAIKKYDRAMLKAEKTAMWPEDKEVWSGFSEIETRRVTLEFWKPREAEENFLLMARALELVKD